MKIRTVWMRGISAALLGLVLVGCASSGMVWREPEQGQLALSRDSPRARRMAAEQMQSHCGNAGYRIVREENVVIGQHTQTTGQGQLWGRGGQVYAQSSTMPVQQLRAPYASA